MKTKIPLLNIFMKLFALIIFPSLTFIPIISLIVDGFSLPMLLILIFAPFYIFGVYIIAIRECIIIDISKKKILVRKAIKFQSITIPFGMITEIIIVHDKYHKKNNFKVIFCKGKEVSFRNYNYTIFGKNQSKKTIKTLEAWNEYIKKIKQSSIIS